MSASPAVSRAPLAWCALSKGPERNCAAKPCAQSYQAHRQKNFPKFQSMYLGDNRTTGKKLRSARSGVDVGAAGSGASSPDPSEQAKMPLKGSLKSHIRMMLIARASSPGSRGRSISPGDRPSAVPGESKQPKSGRGSPNKTLKAPGGGGGSSKSTSRDRTPSPQKKRAGNPSATQTTTDNQSGKSSKGRNAAPEAAAADTASDAAASAGVSAPSELQRRVSSPSSRFRPSPPPAPQPEEGLASPRTHSITQSGNANETTKLPLEQPLQPSQPEAASGSEKPSDLQMPTTPRDVSPSKLAAAPAVLTAAGQIGGVLHFGGAPGPYNRNYFATDPSQRCRIRSACGAAGTMPWSISGYMGPPGAGITNPQPAAGPALQHIRDQQLRSWGSTPYRPRPHSSLPGERQPRAPGAMAGARAIRARHHHYSSEAAAGAGRPTTRAQSSPGVSRSARPPPRRHPAPPRGPRPPPQSSRPKTAGNDSSAEAPFIDWGSSLEGEGVSETGTAIRVPTAPMSATSSSLRKAGGSSMLEMPREVSPSKAAMGRYPFSTVDEHLSRHGFQSEALQAPEGHHLLQRSSAAYTRKRYMSAPAAGRRTQAYPVTAVMAG